jgi:hypothetical protein
MQGPNGEDVFESYAQNKTPGLIEYFGITAQKKEC